MIHGLGNGQCEVARQDGFMAQERPNRLVELWLLARKQWPVARQHFERWLEAVREEPRLIWETVAIRYSVYGLGAILLATVVVKGVGMITPPPPASAKAAASTADFHVVCAQPQCGHHFVIHRKFGFRGFPVECPKCKQKTGAQARKCPSPACQGQWVAPSKQGNVVTCPHCGARFE